MNDFIEMILVIVCSGALGAVFTALILGEKHEKVLEELASSRPTRIIERTNTAAEYAAEHYRKLYEETSRRNKSLKEQNEYLAQRFSDYYDKPKISQDKTVCSNCVYSLVDEDLIMCEKRIKCGEFKRK